MKKHFLFLAIVAITAIVVSSCGSGENKPGRIFMPDMTYSNAYETYSSTKFQHQSDTDAISAMHAIDGTIPRGYLPSDEEVRSNDGKLMSYLFKNYFKNPAGDPSVDDPAQRVMAANMLINPIKKSPAVLAEGKVKYDIYCAVCHGKKGLGNGSIIELEDENGDKTGEDGPYTAIPPSYETRLPGLSDGEMFYSITYGKNMMGGYFTQVSTEDRWKLLHYIKDMAGIEDTNAIADINLETIVMQKGAEFDVPDIYFNTGSADLRSESKEVLKQLLTFFQDNPNVVVEIGSHADTRGDFGKNMTLSSTRAASVVNYLTSNGVNVGQLMGLGYGSTVPLVDCGAACSDEENKKNRRTTFKILALN
jgi:outer membrane protein OmpA-like peptidoglycan-associated protein